MSASFSKQFQLMCFGVLCSFFCSIANAAETVESKSQSVAEQQKQAPLDYVAIVDGEKISMVDYVSALRRGMRKTFYHGNAPEAEIKKYRKDVAEELVDRALKIKEAKRRGLKPDEVAVEKGVTEFDAKFKDDPEWQKDREVVLSKVKEKFEGDSLVSRLESQVKLVKEPSPSELKAYYDSHHDLFTTPEQVRVSLILLRVDPSSPNTAWVQANEEATTIVERLNKGADFAELARIHSSDSSAQNGGDMGYIHAGMLGENAQKVLGLMEKGETSSPVILLEGVGIFRLDDRTKPQLNALETVKERAVQLYKREKSEQQWQALKTKLHDGAKIVWNDAPWR